MLIDEAEAARRVRAARAYARLTRAGLAARTSLTVKQIKSLEDAQRPITTREELLEIARACEVPAEFIEVGFEGAQDVYQELARLFAVVLSRDMPAILEEARRLGVNLEHLGPLTPEAPPAGGGGGDGDGPGGRRRRAAPADG